MVSVCQDSLCKSPPGRFAADHAGFVPIGRALQTASSFTRGSCGSNYLSSGFHHGDFWFLIGKLAKIIDQLHSLIHLDTAKWVTTHEATNCDGG